MKELAPLRICSDIFRIIIVKILNAKSNLNFETYFSLLVVILSYVGKQTLNFTLFCIGKQ